MTNSESSTVSRRTVAKGAAWATPLMVVGTPAAVAAVSQGDVRVRNTACASGAVLGNPAATITFDVCAIDRLLGPGTQFRLTLDRGLLSSATLGGSLNTTSNATYSDGVFTIVRGLPPGSCYALTITTNTLLSSTATLTLVRLGTGTTNRDTTNDSASRSVTGLGVITVCA